MDPNECSICMDTFASLKCEIGFLDCGHFYHESCISEWGKISDGMLHRLLLLLSYLLASLYYFLLLLLLLTWLFLNFCFKVCPTCREVYHTRSIRNSLDGPIIRTHKVVVKAPLNNTNIEHESDATQVSSPFHRTRTRNIFSIINSIQNEDNNTYDGQYSSNFNDYWNEIDDETLENETFEGDEYNDQFMVTSTGSPTSTLRLTSAFIPSSSSVSYPSRAYPSRQEIPSEIEETPQDVIDSWRMLERANNSESSTSEGNNDLMDPQLTNFKRLRDNSDAERTTPRKRPLRKQRQREAVQNDFQPRTPSTPTQIQSLLNSIRNPPISSSSSSTSLASPESLTSTLSPAPLSINRCSSINVGDNETTRMKTNRNVKSSKHPETDAKAAPNKIIKVIKPNETCAKLSISENSSSSSALSKSFSKNSHKLKPHLLSAADKTRIQTLVRDVLQPYHHRSEISSDSYTKINKRVSRIMYYNVFKEMNSADRLEIQKDGISMGIREYQEEDLIRWRKMATYYVEKEKAKATIGSWS